MYRTLISTAILTFMFFTGCADNSTGPNENYTIDDMIGTWNMVSSTMDMTIAMDYSTAFLYMFDEDDCTLTGGTYVDGYGCIMSDIMISILAPLSCEEMEGQLSNNICTFSQAVEMCCLESSETWTITSDGNITIVIIHEGEEETSIETGTISIDGTDMAWTMDDSPELTGTLSISGDNTATFTFAIDNAFDELFEDDVADESFIAAAAAGAISVTATFSMVMEKANN